MGIFPNKTCQSNKMVFPRLLCTSCPEVARLCLTLCNPMDCNPSGFSVLEFSRQEYWNGLPFPSPENLPNSGTEPESPALQTYSLSSEPHLVLGLPKSDLSLFFFSMKTGQNNVIKIIRFPPWHKGGRELYYLKYIALTSLALKHV